MLDAGSESCVFTDCLYLMCQSDEIMLTLQPAFNLKQRLQGGVLAGPASHCNYHSRDPSLCVGGTESRKTLGIVN